MKRSGMVEGEPDTDSRSVAHDDLMKQDGSPVPGFLAGHGTAADDGMPDGVVQIEANSRRLDAEAVTPSREEHDAGSSAIQVHVSSGVPAGISAPGSADDERTEMKLDRMTALQSLPAVGDGSGPCSVGSPKQTNQTECSGVVNVGRLFMDHCEESEDEMRNADVSNTALEHQHVHAAPISNSGYASYQPSQSDDAHLTPEERTRQRRMLRNRESAARSRDKRKYRNFALESSIAKFKATSENLQHLHAELTKLLGTMKAVLKKTKSS
jgi:Basic region leucine zipper